MGWLYVPQIGVDSPILTGQTDTEYLTKDFEGAYSPLGSIFTAHNMASGQMFGSLKQFTDEAFLTANPEAYLYTPERVRKLKVEGWTYLQADDPCFS
ncbi:class B sortase, partial [Mediterraneibacter gnavus]|uniref:class B sortase n=1 Tax=Mediterraneibacter gnavus TaxID=33038 RepID=UPI0022E6135D